jgi:O-antigen/teichoic acid export membrane protein
VVAIRRSPTLAVRRLLSHVRRLGWGVADQAVSSLTNFALVLFVAHTAGAAQFGAFSLAYVTYSLALNASRGLTSDPLLVRFSDVGLEAWRRAVGSCTGTAAIVGMATGACVLVAATVLGGAAKFAFLALGLTLPALLLQDSWRFSFFALGRGAQAFLNDFIWAAALVPALVLLRAARTQNIFWFVFAWGAAAAVAAAAGMLQARVAPRLFDVTRWLSQHRDLSYRYLAANTINSGSGSLLMYSLSLIVGLAAVGYIQAANTLMSPPTVLQTGMIIIGIPEAARILRRSPKRLLQFCFLVSSGLAVAALAWGAVLLVALPRGLGILLVGSIWRPAYPLVAPYAFFTAGICAWGGAEIGLRALGTARRSLHAMIFASTVLLTSGLIGALSGGVPGSVRGIAVAAWLSALVWWWQMHQAMRESGIASARGRHAARRQKPVGKPLRDATASGLASTDVISPATRKANGRGNRQVEHGGMPELEFVGNLPASRRPHANGQVGPNWSAQPQPSSPWAVVVAPDKAYYDRMWEAKALSNSSVRFPVYANKRRFPLAGTQMRIGRSGTTHNLEPEIDLAGPPTDPGVSRLHAVLIAAPNGTWAVLDPGSANGTLLNGRKITIGDMVPLRDGDRINLGTWTVITVHHQVAWPEA